MTRVLILRLDAPLMAFGGPMIDQIGNTWRFPGLAQITGLLGNALGYDHADAERLDRLQQRLRIASLLLQPGREMMDYQTVDLGQAHLVDTGWTTRGWREARGKGEATSGTHIRQRYYWAGSILLTGVALDLPDEQPDLITLAEALDYPARPLFIGRKPCLPATPLVVDTVTAQDLADALKQALALPRVSEAVPPDEHSFPAELPGEADGPGVERVVDRRDWLNQFHGGERLVRRYQIERGP